MWKDTLWPEPPLSFVVGIGLPDRRCEPCWLFTTAPDSAPLKKKKKTQIGLSKQPLQPAGVSLQLWLQQGAHCTLGLHSSITQGVQFVRLSHQAAWGLACHVCPSTTSGSPARVSSAETGKKLSQVSLFSFCQCGRCVLALTAAVILDSESQVEGIPGISRCLGSGVKLRLWILWGPAPYHIVM